MNYTYLPQSPYTTTPTIIMTTPPSSRKTLNLTDNPLVSLLVHDWVSHRPPTLSQPGRAPSPTRAAGPRQGSLAELLLGFNSAELGRISTTINGVAEIVPHGSDEEKWYKEQHLANNTFEPSEDTASTSPVGGGLWPQEQTRAEDGGTRSYVEGEGVRVVVVKIKDGRIADWKGQVRDWVVRGEGDRAAALPNGV